MTRIAIGQTNPVTGDLEGNVRQILTDMRKARGDGADIVVFPETAITGYCCGALYESKEFVRYNQEFLERIIAPAVPDDLVAVVGFVRVRGEKRDGTPDISNSVAVMQGGKVLGTYDKTLLANANHHEDKKYFTPGTTPGIFDVTIKGASVRIGTPICEDIWTRDHDRDIVQEMTDAGAQLILCPNFSYFSAGKQQTRKELCATHATEHAVPVVYCNASGVGDIVKNIMIYDGGSFTVDSTGAVVAQARRFGADLVMCDLDAQGKGTPLTTTTERWEDEVIDALTFEQREYARVIGIPKVQVHLSGGIDSAVVAAIAVQAMGPEHCVFITNPTNDNSDLTKGTARHVADGLGVPLHWYSTQALYETILTEYTRTFGEPPDSVTKGNMQALLRTAQGLTAVRRFHSGIAAAGNHTEIVTNWSTFHDIGSVGAHSPIGDLTKVELYAVAQRINERAGKELIPRGLYDGTILPMAELADAKYDPFDYYVVSGIAAEMIRHRKGVSEIIDAYRTRTLTPAYFPPGPDGRDVYARTTLETFAEATWDTFARSKRSVFKAAQAAPIVILWDRSRGFSNRETIMNAYAGWYDIDAVRTRMGAGA